MNLSDSERVSTVLEALGYQRCDIEEEADILGLVSCSVRQRAIDKAYAKIRKWNSWKIRKNLITFATGCVLPADRGKFLKLFDLFFPINELPDLPDMIRQYGVPTPLAAVSAEKFSNRGSDSSGEPAGDHRLTLEPRTDFWHIAPTHASRFEAFVPIQNGCDKFCSFCAVPFTRGREVSRPSGEILEEVEDLIERGYRCITLLGQNVNSYGLDGRGSEIGFAELLNRIGKAGDASGRELWVYFTSPHPQDMSMEVLETISEHKSLAKQIHLPLQSGDDRLLIKMNRNHIVDRYRSVVGNIRRLIPEATLFTDIIVGFPGETEAQFERTKEAMREFRYNMAYIAMYSPRPGARSARWADDIPHQEKRRRLHILSEELKKSSRAHNEALKGETLRFLVTGEDRNTGYLAARNEGRIIARYASQDTSLVGTFVDLRVVSVSDLSVEGRLGVMRARDGGIGDNAAQRKAPATAG